MLKWTVSRSMSTASSTSYVPPTINKTTRKPFRDLSNTPPADGTRSKVTPQTTLDVDNSNPSSKSTPGRRRRCRSHGSDVRAYFQATKPHARSNKRQSIANETLELPKTESSYHRTPRIDTDIGPLTYIPDNYHISKCPVALTLPTDPTSLPHTYSKTFHHINNNNELPQNVMNEARANLQSHVSDFFKQISVAGSPEDVMEAGSVPLSRSRLFFRNIDRMKSRSSPESKPLCYPKLAKISKLHARCRTPYHTKAPQFKLRETPLAKELASLKIDQDIPKFENMDNTVTEILNKQQQEINLCSNKIDDEIDKKTRSGGKSDPTRLHLNDKDSIDDKDTCKFIEEQMINEDEGKADHNDSSVSSASQLLENPSPISWAFRSPSIDSDGEFTLKRQRGIRRKRQQKDQGINKSSGSKRAKTRSQSVSPATRKKILEGDEPPIQAVNLHVKKITLETDLDSIFDEKIDSKILNQYQKNEETKINLWDLDSPKSSLMDDFPSSKSSFVHSANETSETPLIATVRRCLKYSPEVEIPEPNSRSSIELEYNIIGDSIHIRVIRCKDLKRSYEGPIHAYVKVSLKNPNGGGVVKRTAVHRATPNPVFHETLILPYPNHNCTNRSTSLDIAVWHRDRRARRSELLGCMTLPLPLAQDKEATWHPLQVGSVRKTSTPYAKLSQDCTVSPPLSKDGDHTDNNSNADDFTYLRHLELEPLDPLTGLPLNPGFTARGGRTPCTITRRLIRQSGAKQIPWGFSLSWGRPPRVERVDPGSPAERAGLMPGDHVVFVDTTNVVTRAREDILNFIQAATNQLILEIYRKSGAHVNTQRPSLVNVTLQPALDQPNGQGAIAFTAEVGTGVIV